MPDLFINPDEQKTAEPSSFAKASEDSSTSTKVTANKENHIHALASYCEQPTHVLLQGKNITSSVRLFVRRHVVTNIPWLLTTLVLLFIPLLIQILITLSSTPPPPLPTNFITVFFLFYYLITLTYAFINFLDWFYNIIIITNDEIIDIDYSDVVFHNVAATKVPLIEDVNYTQVGFIKGLFNFGDIFVQTAGGNENIEALSIPQPARIARYILNAIGKGGTH